MILLILILIIVAVLGGINALAKTMLWGSVVVFSAGLFLGHSDEAKMWICGLSGCLSLAFCGAFLLEKRQKVKKDLNAYREKCEIERLMNELELREFERESHIRAQGARSKL